MNLLRPKANDTVYTADGVQWLVVHSDPRHNTVDLLRQTRSGHFRTAYLPWWDVKRSHTRNSEGDYVSE